MINAINTEETDAMNVFVSLLKQDRNQCYSWLCDHGHDLHKNELIDVLKEFVYVINDKDLLQEVAESIEDNCLLSEPSINDQIQHAEILKDSNDFKVSPSQNFERDR